MKTKPTSVRLSNELLEELDQRCRKAGCSRNDFIKNSVELVIKNHSNFDFGEDEEIKMNNQEPTKFVNAIRLTSDSGEEWIQDKDGVLHKIKP